MNDPDRASGPEAGSGEEPRPGGKDRTGARRIRVLLWLAVPVLLGWALRGVPLREIGRILAGLTLGEAATLLAVNLAFMAVVTGRWVLILGALGERLSGRDLPRLAAARLAGFAVSYLTPGPQFGGEPVQLALARKGTGLAYARGTASLLIDRSFDLAGNLAFIGLGLWAYGSRSIGTEGSGWGRSFLAAGGILAGLLPLAYLGSVFAGARPLSALAVRLPRIFSGASGTRLTDFLRAAESEAGAYGRKPLRAAAHLVFSFLAVQGLAAAELWLTMRFLGSPLGLEGTLLLLAGGKLALYAPVPGGLGALEAVQRVLVTWLGYPPGAALALSAWIRVRDLLFALAGLAAAARGSRPRRSGPRDGT